MRSEPRPWLGVVETSVVVLIPILVVEVVSDDLRLLANYDLNVPVEEQPHGQQPESRPTMRRRQTGA
ncbi:MAG: hypothetical protein ACJAYX_003750 [Planctomycetota bacterium]|jgi:hypothetical protein